ncbi:penicillin-binding protein 2 [Candidatus Gracilibacteria bacterium]|nr:penicillin-binding protein 2 [Candidatus Gracilibacteria bacterium]
MFALFALLIIWIAFKYTVLEYGYYKGLADKQQMITVKSPVSRGTIYSNNSPAGVFATSTDLSDLAIDPQEIGSKEKLKTFLTDVVFEDICSKQSDDGCAENLFDYLKQVQDEEFIATDENVKNKIREDIHRKISKEFIDSVIVKENLSKKEVDNLLEFTEGTGSYFGIINNSLYVDPTKVTDKDTIVAKLMTILSLSKEELDFKLSKRTVRYIKILKKIGLSARDMIDARVKAEKINIAQGRMLDTESIFHFLILEANPTRFYPEKNMGGQIVGFVNNENEGKYGIEGYFNEELKGKEGANIAKKDISGRTIGSFDLGERKMANGTDIKLTIDRNIQKEVTKLLSEGVKEFRANKGSVVIMDPKTGAILSMVTYPDFDSNNFGDVYELEKVNYVKYPNPNFDLLGIPLFVEDSEKGIPIMVGKKKIALRSATEAEIDNRAIPKYKYKNMFGPGVYEADPVSSLYEPGSVFKAITMAIGIDTGDIKPSDTYNDKGFVTIDQYKISNVSNECIGVHTYSHALDWSCNVGMIDIVQKIGKSLFYKYINDFGFGQKTNITLDGEVFGKIDPYEKWARVKLFTMAFGQGITATVLQMASAYSALANGGVYMQPYIVDSLTLADGTVVKNTPTPLRRVIKEDTSKKIIAMLTEGAKIGFAKKGGVDGYDVAGKTGTSQIAAKGKYEVGEAGHTITSYGGFAPASNPKFVMIVKIERPRSALYSETTSSAVFSNIAKYLFNYYGIPKSE